MTFEEWWEYEFEAPALGLTIDDIRKAYEAGFNACRDKWGGLDYEETCYYEEGGGL